MINLYNERIPDDPLLKKEPIGILKGAAMNLMGGFADLAGAGTNVMAGLHSLHGDEEAAAVIHDFYRETVKPARDFWSPDPETTTNAGKVIGAISRMAPMFLFGEAAAPLMVGSSTINTAYDLADQGVDAATATGMGIGAGLMNIALIKTPQAGRNVAETLGLAAANPVLGAVQTKIEKEVLQAAGYDSLAEQYDPFDPAGRSVDVVMGLFFGALGHRARKAQEQAFKAGKTKAVSDLDAVLKDKTYREYLDSLPIEAEDALGIIRQHQKAIHDMPFDPKKPGQIQMHLDALGKALDALSKDEPVKISLDVAAEIAKAAEQMQAEPVTDYRTGRPLTSPQEVQTVIGELETEQRKRAIMLKSGDAISKAADKEGMEYLDYQNKLLAEQAEAEKQIKQLQDFLLSPQAKLAKIASKQQQEKPKTEPAKTPAEIEKTQAQETTRAAIDEAIPELKTTEEDWGFEDAIEKARIGAQEAKEAIAQQKKADIESAEEPKPEIKEQTIVSTKKTRANRIPKDATIIGWIENHGRINYEAEHLKGELDILAEGNPRVKTLLNKKGKGYSLDQLALRAKDEGFITEATPEALLEAIAENRMKPEYAEAGRDFAAEAEAFEERQRMLKGDPAEAAEAIVEDFLADTATDIPGGNLKELDNAGNPVYGGMKEAIDRARADLKKTQDMEAVFDRIGLCVRQGG